MTKHNGKVGTKRATEIAFQAKTRLENELYFLRATLTKPVKLDGRLDSFDEGCKRALSSTQPRSARNWSIQLETPARCVIRTILSARSEHEAADQVLSAIVTAFRGLDVQPGHVAVKAPSIYAEPGIGFRPQVRRDSPAIRRFRAASRQKSPVRSACVWTEVLR